MKQFKKQLLELLRIQAPSGKEALVRNYLQPKLGLLVDRMFVDKVGNLLAEKKCGDGSGATVMLSAHMDSVKNIVPSRHVIERDGRVFASKGVLGADDRAGIAAIMTVLRNIDKIDFNGNIKVAFTISEEIGCVGSSAMETEWYKDVNLAVVVDRRGSRDIVTGCGSPWNFCSKEVGKFFEDCSALLGMDWKAVGGGVSDAMTFSTNGVHSVNLSAGYYNEHTEQEYMVISETQDTINLILQAFALINGFYKTFGEIPARYSYSYSYDYGNYGKKGWSDAVAWGEGEESLFANDNYEKVIYEQEGNRYGNVTVSDIQGYFSIYQKGNDTYKDNDVWMTRGDFNDMVDAYLATRGLPTMQAMLKAKASVKKADVKKAGTPAGKQKSTALSLTKGSSVKAQKASSNTGSKELADLPY